MQITWWQNVVCLWCHFLCFLQPQCLCHSHCARHKLACWSSQVCLSSIPIAEGFPFLLLNNHPCFDINLLQCSFNTMPSIGYQHFSWYSCTWLNLSYLYRYAYSFLVLYHSNILEVSWLTWYNYLKMQIMIGILFFLFEFYDDQLLAFMVLVLVWLCELFTLIRFGFLFRPSHLNISLPI